MAQASVITVQDREPTPGTHNFAPRKVSSEGAFFVSPGTVPIGDKTISVRQRRSGSRIYTRVTVALPVLVTETINGVSVPKAPRMAFIDATFRFDDTSTLQERKNAVGIFVNALAASQTVVDSAVTGLEGIW